MVDETVTTAPALLQGWNYAAPYVVAALCAWYIQRCRDHTVGSIDTQAAKTQLKVESESETVQTRIVSLQAQFHSLQDKLPEMIRKEIAAPMIQLHARIDKFESSVRSSLTAAGLKWDQEYTVIPATKPKDTK